MEENINAINNLPDYEEHRGEYGILRCFNDETFQLIKHFHYLDDLLMSEEPLYHHLINEDFKIIDSSIYCVDNEDDCTEYYSYYHNGELTRVHTRPTGPKYKWVLIIDINS